MLENLSASKPKRFRSFKESVLSLILHLTMGYGAIKATTGGAETLKAILQDTTMVFLKPPEPPPPLPPPKNTPPPDAIVAANPARGFQTVVPPTTIPRDIPPVNLNERFNAADFSGKGVEGGVARGIVGGTGPVVQAETFLEAQVDDPVQQISVPKPRYPPVLQQAGIAGRVEVRYVVDTTGHAEPASWRVMRSANTAFEEPAREAIMKGIFKPARIKGQAVRQLVQQAISFTIRQ
jgi:protein TonB